MAPDTYTTQIVNKDPAMKRKSSAVKTEPGEDGPKRVKREAFGASVAASAEDKASGFPQTLHSAFQAPGTVDTTTRPLAFSFSPPAVASTSTSASVGASASSAAGAGGATPSSAAGSAAERYWFLNPPHSFCIEKGQMSTFSPIDFAYLPYMRPDNVVDPATKASTPATTSAETPAEPTKPPTTGASHVASLAPVIQAAYIGDTAGFVEVYSAACGEWMSRVPEYVKAQRDIMGPHTKHPPPAPPQPPSPQVGGQTFTAGGTQSSTAGGDASMETDTAPAAETMGKAPRRGGRARK